MVKNKTSENNMNSHITNTNGLRKASPMFATLRVNLKPSVYDQTGFVNLTKMGEFKVKRAHDIIKKKVTVLNDDESRWEAHCQKPRWN
jgi:hypothetical protein